MTENENSADCPQNSPNDNFEIESFKLAPLDRHPSDLVHCQVPLSAWFRETFLFSKRYFWRLLLLSAVFSLLYCLDYHAAAPCRNGGGDTGGTALSFTAGAERAFAEDGDDFFRDDEDIPESGAAEEDPVEFFDNAEETPAPETESPADPPLSALPENKEAEAPENTAGNPGEKESHPAAANLSAEAWNTSSEFRQGWSIFKLLASIFQAMILCWGIRTIQQDNGRWRNLLFPSWTTILKSFAVSIIILFLAGALVFIIAGPLAPVFDKLGSARLPVMVLLLTLLICGLLAKFALSVPLVLDRDFGPFRAMNISWAFMRSNVGTLIFGMLIFVLGITVLLFLVSIPLGMILFHQQGQEAFATPEAVDRLALSSQFRCALGTATFIFSTISILWSTGFISVFYLMATGQRRPGAWPREMEPAAQTEEPRE